MKAPLAVRVDDGLSSRAVTRAVRGLRFRKTAPGGFADASFTLDVPTSLFTDLGPADRTFITDGRNGRVIWEGYTNNPGLKSGSDGEGYEISALGPMALAEDRAERLIYLDGSLDKWEIDWVNVQAPSANMSIGQFPEDAGTRAGEPAIFCQFTPGQPITNGSLAGMRYRGFEGSPMKLGGFAGFYDAGQTDSNYQLQWFYPGTIITAINQSTQGGGIEKYSGFDFTPPAGASVGFRLRRVLGGATTVGTDNVWGAFGEVKILGQLLDRNGAERAMPLLNHVTVPISPTFATTDAYVLASEVVEDLLGRVLTFCDPVTSTITPTTEHIDQLAYYDAVKAAKVLEDLSVFEPDFLWEVLESNASGRHRFNYRDWPTDHRYQIPSSMVLDQPGGDVDLCNRIAVNWTDLKGNQRVTLLYATVPELGTRTRDAEPVTLPEGQGSLWNAFRLGTGILAAKAKLPRAGTITIDRPILDSLRGSMVQPWEIEPGYVARLQSTGENLRITEVEYDDDACAATLTLGQPVLTESQRIARLEKVSPKK